MNAWPMILRCRERQARPEDESDVAVAWENLEDYTPYLRFDGMLTNFFMSIKETHYASPGDVIKWERWRTMAYP